MSDFQREHRYWVIKRKRLTPEQDEACRQFCGRLHDEGVPEVEAVVVESDWHAYEIVWGLVERVATGQPLPYLTDEDPDVVASEAHDWEQLAYRYQAERDALAAHVERLSTAIRYATDYLGGNKLNTIGHGSKAHRELVDAAGETPTTSLARLKAEAKNELLSTVREMDITNSNGDARLDSEWRAGWNQCIRELRRQAEEPTE